jgi:serine phosphatase RsbU (regulator of sigma subunit)
VFVESGGDWFDVIPLDSGCWGIVVGDVVGRGVELATTMSELRAAVRAYAVLEGDAPARVVRHLDRLAQATGLGDRARLVYLSFQPGTGEIRFSNAGNCPPLVLHGDARGGRFVDTARSLPLGAMAGADRPEATLRLARGSTLLLFTDGLVESRTTSRGEGLRLLMRAALDAPPGLEDLCDHVVHVCSNGIHRDDDICLLGVRRMTDAHLSEKPLPPRSYR